MNRNEKRRLYRTLSWLYKNPEFIEPLLAELDALEQTRALDLAVPIPELEELEIGGQKWKTHPRSACAGDYCCFHNPSDHPLKDAPMNTRYDRAWVHESGVLMLLIERTCKHGHSHADPDSARWLNSVSGDDGWGVHGGCDGCCSGRNINGR